MKKMMAVLLMATLIVMSSLTVFAANQGKGDMIQDRLQLMDKTCVVTTVSNQSDDCTQDQLKTRDMLKTLDKLKLQDMLKTRDRLRLIDCLIVQDQIRLKEHINLQDGTCLTG